MIKELEILVELKRFLLESLDLGNVDKLFVEGSCDILEKALNTLNLFKSALTLETIPLHVEREEHDNGSISLAMQNAYNYIRHELDVEGKKALTQWVIENIDKEQVKEWLNTYE